MRQRTRRRAGGHLSAILWAMPVALICAALALAEPAPAPVRALRDLAFDTFLSLKPRQYDPEAPVRVIDIDEESLKRIGQWPWPRTTLATLVEKLGAAGVSVVALDILLAEPDRTSFEQVLAHMPPSPSRDELERVWREKGVSNDTTLAETISRQPVVVSLAGSMTSSAPARVKAGFAWQGDSGIPFLREVFPGAVLPLSPIAEAAAGLGSINISGDRDLTVRRIHTFVRVGDAVVPSLAMEALRVAQQASTYLIRSSNSSGERSYGAPTGIIAVRNGDVAFPTESDGTVRVHYAGSQAQRRIPAWKILAGEFKPEDVQGRIMFVGASAAALGDIRATPLEQAVAGVDLHAEVIEHIVSGAHLARPDYARGFEAIVILAAGLLAAVISSACAALCGAALALIFAFGLTFGSWLFFTQAGLLFDPVIPPLALLGGFASATVAAYRRTERDRAHIRDAFGRYVSPAVIEALIADPSKLELGGELRPVTVMFTDVRNFTQRSEHLPANEVVGFLNAIHTPLSEAVMQSGGTVDKYIGDGMMAFWNAPLDDAHHVRHGLRAALAIVAGTPAIARQTSGEAKAAFSGDLAIGIGLHTGIACVGNLGSRKRLEYSIVGDTVNSAARIEPLCKDYGAAIIVSEAIAMAAPDFALVEIDETVLRGRRTAMRLFALIGDERFAARAEFIALKSAHEAALAAWRAGKADASEKIAACEAMPEAAPLLGVYRKWREKTGLIATA